MKTLLTRSGGAHRALKTRPSGLALIVALVRKAYDAWRYPWRDADVIDSHRDSFPVRHIDHD